MSLAESFPFSEIDAGAIRHDWARAEVRALFALPFPDLIFRAQTVHRLHFDPAEVQISTLISIKTGGCPEDCAYCPQSARYDTGVKAEKLMPLQDVLSQARAAKDAGASRFFHSSLDSLRGSAALGTSASTRTSRRWCRSNPTCSSRSPAATSGSSACATWA